jgi:hypothetical protein
MIYGTELLLQIQHGIHLFLSSSRDREITTQRYLFCTKVLAQHTESIYKADPTSYKH